MNFTVYPLLEQEKVEGQEDLFDNDYFYISLSYFCSPTYAFVIGLIRIPSNCTTSKMSFE